jgi:hypothetical protein
MHPVLINRVYSIKKKKLAQNMENKKIINKIKIEVLTKILKKNKILEINVKC